MSSKTQIAVAVVIVVIIVVVIYYGMGYMTAKDDPEQPAGCKITPPENPEGYARGDGKITFSWESVVGANNYVIYMKATPTVSADDYDHKVETSTNPFSWDIPDGVSPHMYFVIVARRDICSTDTCVGCVSQATYHQQTPYPPKP